MLRTSKAKYGGIKQLESFTMLEQIDEKLHRFYKYVNQTMIAHLYEKFRQELNKLLIWFLSFGNRRPEWRRTKPYELKKLGT
jgi:hypothetical protein